MLPIYILQVLGQFRYNYVEFEVFGEYYETYLSSTALQSALTDNLGVKPKIILLAPTSLIMVDKLRDYKEELINLYCDDYDLFKTTFAKNVRNIVVNDYGVDSNSLDIFVIESMGRYRGHRVTLDYNIHPNNIKLSMLNLLLGLWSANRVYIDISTGLNQYVNLLMDAFRGYIVNRKLSMENPSKLETWYTLTSPVGKEGEKYRLYIQEFDVKTFLDWPLKDRKIDLGSMLLKNGENRRKLNISHRELNNKLIKYISKSMYSFNSIMNNIPLLLFEDPFIDGENFIDYKWLNSTASNLRNEIIDLTNKLLKPDIKRDIDTISVRSLSLDYNYILGLHIAISLYIGLKNIFNLPKKKPCFRIEEGEIIGSFRDIIDSYRKLHLALNARFLDRDLRSIWSLRENIKDEWTPLLGIINKVRKCGEEEVTMDKHISDEVRNFYAHSGFLRQMIKVRKKDDWIEIKYVGEENVKRKLMRWLRNPQNYGI